MNRRETKAIETEHTRTVVNRKIDIRFLKEYEASS